MGLTSWRTACKRLAIGRMPMSFAENERALLRQALAEVGVAKASIVAPAIERLGQWRTWLTWALQLPAVALQEKVSQALQALPRGLEPSPSGTRFRQMVLAAMPDLEAMELVDRFFEMGAHVVGTDHAVAIFLAGCRECLPEWEIQVTRHLLEVTGDKTSAETPDPERLTVSEWLRRTREFLPTGAKSGWPTHRSQRTPAGVRSRAITRGRSEPRAFDRARDTRRHATAGEWALLRLAVIVRARFRCQACGAPVPLDIHHVVKRSQGGSDFDLDRLVALCRRCHDLTDAPSRAGRLVITPRGDGVFRFTRLWRASKWDHSSAAQHPEPPGAPEITDAS